MQFKSTITRKVLHWYSSEAQSKPTMTIHTRIHLMSFFGLPSPSNTTDIERLDSIFCFQLSDTFAKSGNLFRQMNILRLYFVLCSSNSLAI